MPNDPLALILAELPDEAGYDAVYAALMATERGRRFLTEFADRNRHADTTAIVGAIARIEATLRGDGPPRADAAGDLLEIAAAIDRIGAALAAGATAAPGISAAIERLLDIAFMLHERPVEATLCDGLDAAIREISQATMRSESTAAGVREAAELLGALAGRVCEMMALSIAVRGTHRPAEENVAATSGAGFFELAANDGEIFAQAVAELAASLPTLADAPSEPVEAAPELESGQGAPVPAAEIAPSEPVEAAPEPESGQDAPTPAAEIAPNDNVLLPADETQPAATEAPDNDTAPPQPAPTDVSLSEAVLNQAFADDYFSNVNLPDEASLSEETESAPISGEEPLSEAVAPAQNFSTEPVPSPQPNPQEDPADLFEPGEAPMPPVEAATPVTADAAVPAEPPAEPARAVPPPPPVRAIPRPPGNDPLAAVRDLSAEELIALFS
jgi:hypothetical protein